MPLASISGALMVQKSEGNEPENLGAEISWSGSMLNSVLTSLLQHFRANTSVLAEIDTSLAGAVAKGAVDSAASLREAPGRAEFRRLLLPDRLEDASLLASVARRGVSHLVLAAVFISHSKTASHVGVAGGGGAGAPLVGLERPVEFELNAAVYEVATGIPVARLQWTEHDANVTVWTLFPLPVAGVTVDQQRYLRGMGAIVGRRSDAGSGLDKQLGFFAWLTAVAKYAKVRFGSTADNVIRHNVNLSVWQIRLNLT